MRRNIILVFILSLMFFQADVTWAWGKRGHSIVCETAAYLVGNQPGTRFMKSHSFDLGYYCNVPDIVWKRPATYSKEWFNHFMDMEIFNRDIPAAKLKDAFAMSRAQFEADYPNIKPSAGRAFWRIREILKRAQAVTQQLKNDKLTSKERQKLEAEWLVDIGTMGHYVGDLSQPLHVTENYDGKMSGQKGVHVWFETDAVDQLYMGNGPELEGSVLKKARADWHKFNPKWKNEKALQVLEELANSSNKNVATILKLDKKIGRKSLKRAAQAFRPMIVDRLAVGAVALADLWQRELGWKYDGKKFYTFVSDPDFIPVGNAK